MKGGFHIPQVALNVTIPEVKLSLERESFRSANECSGTYEEVRLVI